MNQEALQRLMEMVRLGSGFTNTIGIRAVSVEPGVVTLALDKRPDILQFTGHFHGGAIAGLADHAAGGAVSTLLVESGRIAITVDLHVKFIKAADGDTLIAKAKALKTGGTIGVAQVEITSVKNGMHELCAIATGTMRAVELPRRPQWNCAQHRSLGQDHATAAMNVIAT